MEVSSTIERTAAPSRVHELLSIIAIREPESLFLRAADTMLTYGQSWRDVCALAAWLAAEGVNATDKVVLVIADPLRLALLAFATSAAAATFVIVHPDSTTDSVEHVVRETRPAVLICDQTIGICNCERVVVLDSRAWKAALSDRGVRLNERPATSTPDIACIIYTSGSSGVARGVMMSHSSVLFVCDAIQRRLNYASNDVIGVYLPLAFDYGLYQLFLAAQVGGSVVLGQLAHVGPGFPQSIARAGVTILAGVPNSLRVLAMLLERRAVTLPKLRAITSTGERLEPALVGRLRSLIPRVAVYPMYGLTECKRVSIALPDDFNERPDTVGKPLDGTIVSVIDTQGRRLGPGELGQLVVQGPHLAAGYVATAADERFGSFEGAPALFTGDYGCLDDCGFLYIHGRIDGLLKHRGYRLNPIEIERAAERCRGVRSAIVVQSPTSRRLVLVATLHATSSLEELTRTLAKGLEPHKMPDEVRVLGSLPMNPNGKIDRVALIEVIGRHD